MPGWYVIKDQPPVLTEDKAWLLGHLAADGGFVNKPGRKCSVAVYAGLDRDIAQICVDLFDDIYGAAASIVERVPDKAKRLKINYDVHCYWRNVVEDLQACGVFGRTTWRVPLTVLSGTMAVQGAWLSGYFDGDGGINFKQEVSRRTVVVTSINGDGLRQVSDLLTSFGIRHLWHTRKAHGRCRPAHSLHVTYHADLKTFAEKIGFRSPHKADKLQRALESYQRQPLRTEDVEKHVDEIRRRRETGETHVEIARALGLVREVVSGVCYRHGIEPVGREGNAADGARSIGLGPKERLLNQVLALREQGKFLTEIATTLGFKNGHRVQDLLQRAARKGTIARRSRGTKFAEALPRILQMRRSGSSWQEIGEALGYVGPRVQFNAINIRMWAKQHGLWPEESVISS